MRDRKNLEADALNPNLYNSLEDLKDNRKDNIYEEIKQKTLKRQSQGKLQGPSSLHSDALPRLSLGFLNDTDPLNVSQDPSFANDTMMTSLDVSTDDLQPQDLNTCYDKLDFSRPVREHKPHYTSSSTLKSVKSGKDVDIDNGNRSLNRHSVIGSGDYGLSQDAKLQPPAPPPRLTPESSSARLCSADVSY